MSCIKVSAIALSALGFLLAACDQGEAPKKSEAQLKMDEDTALLKDTARAGPELERRLLASVQVQNGIVAVRNPVTRAIETDFLPTTTPWVLKCGMTGLSIVFGSSVTGNGSSTSNDVEVYLAFGIADQDNCALLGPRLADRLRSLLQSDQATPQPYPSPKNP
jgi:hypothetical protein